MIARHKWLFAGLAVLLLPAHVYCNLLFRCGCSLIGGTEHCNIHEIAGPTCPWCTQPALFVMAGLVWVACGLGAAFTVRRWRPLALVGGFFGGVFVSGALTVCYSGYPHFLIK